MADDWISRLSEIELEAGHKFGMFGPRQSQARSNTKKTDSIISVYINPKQVAPTITGILRLRIQRHSKPLNPFMKRSIPTIEFQSYKAHSNIETKAYV